MECTIYMADGCNLRCSYCYQGETKNNSFLKQDTLEQILAFIGGNNLPGDPIELVFLGGEPLLNKKMLYKAIELIRCKYTDIMDLFHYHITTNGILLDEEIIDFFIENHFQVSISIDGDKRTHNLNRISVSGRDVYDKIIHNIYLMKEKGLDFSVRMTTTANNVFLLYDNIRYFQNLGIRKYHIGIDYIGEWDGEALEELNKQMEQLRAFYINEIIDTEDMIMDIFDYKITTFVFEREPLYCSAGTEGHVTFNSKGEIYPCGFVTNDQRWRLGTVDTALSKKRFHEAIRTNVQKKATCHSCEIGFTCSGAKCGFLNYVQTGLLNLAGSTTCSIERIMYSHQLKAMQELYMRKHPRLIKFIEIACEKDMLSLIMKEFFGSDRIAVTGGGINVLNDIGN